MLFRSPLTHDGNGNLLNTNADTIAGETAKALAEYFDVTLVYCGMTELWGHVRKAEAGNGKPGASGVPATQANPGGNGKP